MRRKLLDTFDEIYFLNLHGSSRIGEGTPEGDKDENVFDIQQGVAIAFYVKFDKPSEEKKVYYADLWGLRSQKYEYLFGNDLQTTNWQELKPVAPHYFFVPKNFAFQKEYEKFWNITEIFREGSSGVKTHRDHFLVGFTKEEIIQRLRVFTGILTDEFVKEALKLKDTRDWKLSESREKAKELELKDKIHSYAYRPFNERLICYEASLIDRGCDRWDLMKHLLKKNFSLALMRKPIPSEEITQVLVVNSVGDVNFYAFQTYFFPLYLYLDEPNGMMFNEEKRIPNFTSKFLQAIKKSLGTEPTPEEIFYYIYAILYSPTYRKRYEEFLKIDFPRIPLPSDYQFFQKLSNLGKELVDLHLLKHPVLSETDIGFPQSGSNMVEKVKYDQETQRVYINNGQYFEGIAREVWEYQIGAYQVMEKYLKDRKDRKLSLNEIDHYMKMAKVIHLTIELQRKVDDIYINN